jgi:hypothetical protein
MVAGRVNFQRVYDLVERVLPDWVDTAIPSHEEMQRALVERGAHSFGICQPLQTAEYAYLKRNQIRPILKDLVAQGVLAEVEVALHDGSTTGMVVHRDHLGRGPYSSTARWPPGARPSSAVRQPVLAQQARPVFLGCRAALKPTNGSAAHLGLLLLPIVTAMGRGPLRSQAERNTGTLATRPWSGSRESPVSGRSGRDVAAAMRASALPSRRSGHRAMRPA